MATYTPNLNLKKPTGNEYYDVVAEDNDTKDKIDLAIGNHASQLAEKATRQELQAIASGSPKGTYTTLSTLQTAFPTGNTNVYVVTADGKWHYWNGSAWTPGGVYQSTGIAKGAVVVSSLETSVQKVITDNAELYKPGKVAYINYGFDPVVGTGGSTGFTRINNVALKKGALSSVSLYATNAGTLSILLFKKNANATFSYVTDFVVNAVAGLNTYAMGVDYPIIYTEDNYHLAYHSNTVLVANNLDGSVPATTVYYYGVGGKATGSNLTINPSANAIKYSLQCKIGNPKVVETSDIALKSITMPLLEQKLQNVVTDITDSGLKNKLNRTEYGNTPVNGDAGAFGYTRIINASLKRGYLTEVSFYCGVPGTVKIKILSNSPGTKFSLITEFSVVAVVGVNTYKMEIDYPTTFVEKNYFIGAYSTDAKLTSIPGEATPLYYFLLQGDLTGNDIAVGEGYLSKISLQCEVTAENDINVDVSYGAPINGLTVEGTTSNLQKLITANKDSSLYLKPGTYVVDDLYIPNGFKLTGVGNVIIKARSIHLHDPLFLTEMWDIVFENIRFDFTDSSETDYIKMWRAHNTKFINCKIYSYADKDFNLISGSRCYYTKISMCEFKGFSKSVDGKNVSKGTAISGVLLNASLIHDNMFTILDNGILITNNEQIEIHDNNFEHITGRNVGVFTVDGLEVVGLGTNYRTASSNNHIHNNRFESHWENTDKILPTSGYVYFGPGTYLNSFEDNYCEAIDKRIQGEVLQVATDLGVQNTIQNNSQSNSRHTSRFLEKEIINPNSELDIYNTSNNVPLNVVESSAFSYTRVNNNVLYMECVDLANANGEGFEYQFKIVDSTPFFLNIRYSAVGQYAIVITNETTASVINTKSYNSSAGGYVERTFSDIAGWSLIAGDTYSIKIIKQSGFESNNLILDIDFIRVVNAKYPVEGLTKKSDIHIVNGTFDYMNYTAKAKTTILDDDNMYISNGIKFIKCLS